MNDGKRRGTGGGAAAAGGMDFQHRVTAWVAVHTLAEKDAPSLWDLPTDTTLEWLRCETEQPVDDLLVGTSANGLAFAQIKRTLQMSKNTNSDLASALDQFVRQFLSCRAKTEGTQPWDRPLDSTRDRLVLITSSNSSKPVRDHLPAILRRIRLLPSDHPLDQAATNSEERRVLSTTRAHLIRSWKNVLGVNPSDHDLRQLYCLIRVQILDVEEDRPGELVARNLLRTAILQDPNQDDAAWRQLIVVCTSFAAQRSGADRPTLQRKLLNAGIPLKAPRSYQRDIVQLKQYSATTFASLSHLAQIRVGTSAIKIRRPSTEALKRAAEEYSILVVGEPGAGKSGALHDLVDSFIEGKRDYIFLAVDRLAARSLAELQNEIGLDHGLSEILGSWPQMRPAFLVIDALDAARGDPAGTMIRDLIRMVMSKGGLWRVVASIRKFDLRYGVEIKQIFSGAPPTEFCDNEFRALRHLNVPTLSDDELNQLSTQSVELDELVHRAPDALRGLLRVPFNLRLMAELLSVGVASHELTPIRTQLELLESYWLHRVIRADGQGDAREGVLRKTCQKMVETRGLRADRSAVGDAASSTHLSELLSCYVLLEWQPSPNAPPNRYILAFSHNVLFDYAVARLLLRGTPDAFVNLLVSDPEMAVVVRPSLVLHFHYLWTADSEHRQFWELIFLIIRADRVPEIAKLIGPSVAAELVQKMSDMEPLCAILDDPNLELYPAAEKALRHLFGALLAGAPAERVLVGRGASPWCELLERVSRSLRPPVAYTVRSLLTIICEHPEVFTDDQRNVAGQTARRLLKFAWSHTPRDQWLVVHALECVCRTFESDPSASARLLRRCLEPKHLSQYGFEELPWLTRELKRIISIDPDLVECTYRAAFNYRETSEEQTPMGSGRIMSLISNRRQDYEMALYALAEVFPAFLDQAPENAIRALIAVMEAYVSQRHSHTTGEAQEETFELAGNQARIRTDYSSIWDRGDKYRHEEPLKMIDAFQQYLEKLTDDPQSLETFRKIIRLIVSENRLAVIWRRVLLVAASRPGTLGKDLISLAWAIPMLTCYDTTHPAGDFLKAIFPLLDQPARERVERGILSIPDGVPAERREGREHERNRLLGCLSDTGLVTEEARLLLEQLKADNAVPSNEPPVHFHTWSGPYGEEEYLRDQGVPVEAEANRKIRDLERPVKEFADRHLNSTPTLEEASDILSSLQLLREALSRANADGVHPEQCNHALGTLSAASNRIARIEGLSCEEPLGSFVSTILLETSHHPVPAHDPEHDAQFDEFPSWGGPSPRIEAAEGLISLARHPICSTPDVLSAILHLSGDPVPAVRFQIASRISVLYRTAPEPMWQIIERMVHEDQSRGVLQGLLSGPFPRFAGSNPDRVADLTRTIFDRVKDGPGAKKVRELCIGIFTGLYIWRDHAQSREIILKIVANPASHPDEAPHLLAHLGEALTHGPTHPPDPTQDAIRHRAIDLLDRILCSARDGLLEIEQRHPKISFNEWPPQDQESAKSLARLIDHVGRDIYFSSGAYDNKKGLAEEYRGPIVERARRFYREIRPILDKLADVGLASVTHRLLETLEYFIPLDPQGVFLCIGRVVRAGQKGAYQYESLAADLIVKLVERYLAEYRTLLRDNAECRQTLIEVLDVFVQAGWPSARRLTYRLEEIFR